MNVGDRIKGLEQVIILCGGRGVRLRPMTDEIPKVLAPLNGRPILDHALDFYRSKGFFRFTLCLGYKGDKVKEHYSVLPSGTELNFSDAGENASMLERVWLLREFEDERFFVSYGDTLIDLDIDRMLETHLKKEAQATIVTAKIRNPFGLVTSDLEDWATSFAEKPILNYYIGSFIVEKAALGYITSEMLRKPDGKGLVDFFLCLINQRKLAVFEHSGAQLTFNTEPERQMAELGLGQFYTFLEKE